MTAKAPTWALDLSRSRLGHTQSASSASGHSMPLYLNIRFLFAHECGGDSDGLSAGAASTLLGAQAAEHSGGCAEARL
jgi:hypothetical protein